MLALGGILGIPMYLLWCDNFGELAFPKFINACVITCDKSLIYVRVYLERVVQGRCKFVPCSLIGWCSGNNKQITPGGGSGEATADRWVLTPRYEFFKREILYDTTSFTVILPLYFDESSQMPTSWVSPGVNHMWRHNTSDPLTNYLPL